MTRLIALLAGTLALAPVPSLAQSEWIDIKDPNELRALYSNKTFKGKDWMDRSWVGHYRADGAGIMILEGGRYPRTWEVSGSDQICVTTSMNRACYRFQRHKLKNISYRAFNEAGVKVSDFDVEDGVPKF